MTLTDFLLARVAEDEAAARTSENYSPPLPGDWAAERALVECEAKRRIVASIERAMRLGTNGLGPGVQRHLAAVYADHPDYREEWRP